MNPRCFTSFYKPPGFKQSISFCHATSLFVFMSELDESVNVSAWTQSKSRHISFLATHQTCTGCDHVTMLPTQLVAFVLCCDDMVLFVWSEFCFCFFQVKFVWKITRRVCALFCMSAFTETGCFFKPVKGTVQIFQHDCAHASLRKRMFLFMKVNHEPQRAYERLWPPVIIFIYLFNEHLSNN